jgi:hypothetical protein
MSTPLRPLREEATQGVVERRAADIVASARPIEPSPVRMQRVADGIRLRAHHRGRILIRPVIAIGALVCASAAAAAVSWWATRSPEPASAPPSTPARAMLPAETGEGLAAAHSMRPPAPVLAPSILEPPRLARVFVVPAAPPPIEDESDDARQLVPSETPVAPATQAAPTPRAPSPSDTSDDSRDTPDIEIPSADVDRESFFAAENDSAAETEPPAVRAHPAASAKGIEGSDEASLLLFATTKLRRERNPREAIDLLSYARARFPEGALGQERLALEIEARMMLGDGKARALAERYLARHPNGPFRATAEAALGAAAR